MITTLIKINQTRNIMASSIYTFLLLLSSISLPCLAQNGLLGGSYKSIISFGDSIADTGNAVALLEESLEPAPHYAFPPYGETFFQHPTGRCSDGRIIIDFIAKHFGLPLVPPYFGNENASSASIEHGLNFAVVGATALNTTFLEERGIRNNYTKYALDVQVNWFKESLPHLCGDTSACKTYLQSSLILMGEIGGNDINYAFFAKKKVEEISSLVPPVLNTISSAINELIELGAVAFLVPGNFPIGCSPIYLTMFASPNKEDYDPETGCLNWLNEFAGDYNEKLQTELNRLQQLHQDVVIKYGDYYNATMPLFRSPKQYGFSGGVLTACCGGGGQYNVNTSVECGYPPFTTCDTPSTFVNWDGIHFTESAYERIAKGLLDGSFTAPPPTSPFLTEHISRSHDQDNQI